MEYDMWQDHFNNGDRFLSDNPDEEYAVCKRSYRAADQSIVFVRVKVERITEKAVLCNLTLYDHKKTEWFPLSECLEPKKFTKNCIGKEYRLYIPQWLADKKEITCEEFTGKMKQ